MKKRITEYLAYIDALLIPYVMHYYLLENSVQKMYERMMNKIEPSFQVKPDDKK